MDNARFAKFAKDSELLGTNLSLTDVDMIFVHVKRRGQRRIDYTEFERAVRGVLMNSRILERMQVEPLTKPITRE